MAGGYTHNPGGGEGVAKQLREMQAELEQLRKMVTGLGIQLDPTTNSLVVSSGRAITLEDTSGRVMVIIGSDGTDVGIKVFDTSGNLISFQGTGTGGTGLQLDRPDGTVSFMTKTDTGGFLGIYDRQSNYIITDDTTSGQGIARPYVPFGAFADNSPPTQTTTSSTFSTVATLIGYKQHPKVTAQILCQSSDASTTGEARLVDQSSNQVGPTITIPAGDFSYHTLPASAIAGAHMTQISLNLQIRRTAGTGTIGARGVSAWGVESSAS